MYAQRIIQALSDRCILDPSWLAKPFVTVRNCAHVTEWHYYYKGPLYWFAENIICKYVLIFLNLLIINDLKSVEMFLLTADLQALFRT